MVSARLHAQCVYLQHHSEMVEIVKPFELVYKLMTTKFKLTESVNFNIPFILMAELSCTSPWQLYIVESNLEVVNPDALRRDIHTYIA